MLKVEGFIDRLDADMINQAFSDAAEAGFKGVIDYKLEDTASLFEMLNPASLVYLPISAKEKTDVVRRGDPSGKPSTLVALRGFFSETGYAQQILNTITDLAMYEGNIATPQEKADKNAPQGTIQPTPDYIKKQVVPDGQPIRVAFNSVMGRMAINFDHEYWFDPNYQVVLINGVRDQLDAREIQKRLVEFDQVHGMAPYRAGRRREIPVN
jgi:hypothetical protein